MRFGNTTNELSIKEKWLNPRAFQGPTMNICNDSGAESTSCFQIAEGGKSATHFDALARLQRGQISHTLRCACQIAEGVNQSSTSMRLPDCRRGLISHTLRCACQMAEGGKSATHFAAPARLQKGANEPHTSMRLPDCRGGKSATHCMLADAWLLGPLCNLEGALLGAGR